MILASLQPHVRRLARLRELVFDDKNQHFAFEMSISGRYVLIKTFPSSIWALIKDFVN